MAFITLYEYNRNTLTFPMESAIFAEIVWSSCKIPMVKALSLFPGFYCEGNSVLAF